MVIARRVRGRFSVTRLLSRSVRFYFVLSRSLLLPPRQLAPLRLTLSLIPSWSILPAGFLDNEVVARTLVPRCFCPSGLLSLSHLSCFRSLVSVSRVTVLRSYFPLSRPIFRLFPSLAPTLSHPRPICLTLLYSLSRAPSPSPIISGSPFFACPFSVLPFPYSFHFSPFLPTCCPFSRFLSRFLSSLELYSHFYLLPFSRVIGDKVGGSGPSSI